MAACRVVIALAMLRTGGSISASGRLLDVPRKTVRDKLRCVGLYAWGRALGAENHWSRR